VTPVRAAAHNPGVRAAARAEPGWRVLAVFGRAIYLSGADEALRVIVDHRSPRGPLHWRVRGLPVISVGDPVDLTSGLLSFPGGQVRIEEPWVGAQPRQSRSPALKLGEVAARLGGRGPGLTPAGDDVLAGVLLARWGASDEGERAEALAIARNVETNRISLAFLEAAAQGQCIEPSHDLLVALVQGEEAEAARARMRLTAYGATSGAALAVGIAGELADADVDELCRRTPGVGPGRGVVAQEVQ
jgi:Protein of unknown function (DUF2877)